MKPYYDADGITLYHGDCREVLPSLSADLVVTDPPYGIKDQPLVTGGKYGRRGDNTWHPPSDWDGSIDPEWGHLVSVAANTVAWFGHWRKRSEVEATVELPLRAEIIWAKDMHVGPPCPLAMRDERIWLFARTGLVGQRFDTTVWDEPVIPTWERKFHKNQKPLRLMTRLLAWLPSGSVIDPFMGSGTTLVAAKALGRKAVGIETEESYCEIAARRLGQGVLDFGEAG